MLLTCSTKNNCNNNGNNNNIVTYLVRCIYLIGNKDIVFSQIKVQGIKSARRASMQQCNYTTDGMFNLHMGCHSVHRGSGGGGA